MSGSSGRRLAILRLGLLVAAIAVSGAVLLLVGGDKLSEALEAASDSTWGVIGFIVLYIALVVAFAPGTFGTITAAAVFGFGTGLLVSMTGATIGASIAFVISRHIGRDGVVQLLGDRVRSVDDFVGEREFVSILILRLLPIVPFNALNYAAGLTNVRFSWYLAATIVGMAPGATLTSWTVSQANDLSSASFWVGVVLSVVAVGASILVARRLAAGRSINAGAQG